MLTLIVLNTAFAGTPCDEHFLCPGECYMYGDPEQLTYHIDTTDIPAGWIPSITAAAAAFGSGPGELNAGPEWTLIRGGNTNSHGENNGLNEIWDEDAAYFINLGLDGDTPVVVHSVDDHGLPVLWPIVPFPCPVWAVEYDIVFNSDISWSTGLTSARSDLTQNTVGQASLWAFTLVSGLGTGLGGAPGLSAGNDHATGNGDSSQKWRISGQDFETILDLHPCDGPQCVDGVNFTASKFVHTLFANGVDQGLDDGVAEEVWDTTGAEAATEFWAATQGATVPFNNSPHQIMVHMTGTSTNASVGVKWRFTAQTDCGAPFWPIASSTINNMNPGDMVELKPATFTVPNNIPDGTYYLCAIVDPLNVWSETDENDNNLRSERMFTVL